MWGSRAAGDFGTNDLSTRLNEVLLLTKRFENAIEGLAGKLEACEGGMNLLCQPTEALNAKDPHFRQIPVTNRPQDTLACRAQPSGMMLYQASVRRGRPARTANRESKREATLLKKF